MMRLMRVRLAGAFLLFALAGAALAEAAPAAPAAAAPAADQPAARIPFKQDREGAGALAYQSIAALVLASLAAYAIVLSLKRMQNKGVGPLRKARRLQSIESMRLSRRGTLHVVLYHGEELLLAESEHGLQLVASRPAAGAEGGTHA